MHNINSKEDLIQVLLKSLILTHDEKPDYNLRITYWDKEVTQIELEDFSIKFQDFLKNKNIGELHFYSYEDYEYNGTFFIKCEKSPKENLELIIDFLKPFYFFKHGYINMFILNENNQYKSNSFYVFKQPEDYSIYEEFEKNEEDIIEDEHKLKWEEKEKKLKEFQEQENRIKYGGSGCLGILSLMILIIVLSSFL